MKLRPFDYAALAISLAAVAAFAVLAYAGSGRGSEVRIEAPGAQYLYPLSPERTLTVEGPLGKTVVAIRGGKAFVEASPCRDKLCITMGAVSKPGQWIACLPNRIFIRMSGSSGEKVDDSTY